MKETISTLCEFFDRALPNLHKTYQWKIPVIENFDQTGKSSYEENINLKNYLNNLWENADEHQKLKLAHTIVSDWGGIRANRTATLKSYIEEIAQSQPRTPLEGIASYSKIFSIADPGKYAIYDARVAACLNAIQLNANIHTGTAFNYVPGRNNIIGHTGKRIGFTQLSQFSVPLLNKNGWTRIRLDETYARYSELLTACLQELPGRYRYELEMALFSSAENECKHAIAMKV